MDQGAAIAKRLLHGVIEAKIMEAKLSVTSYEQPKPTASSMNQNWMVTRKVLSVIKKLPLIGDCQIMENSNGPPGQHGTSGRRLYVTIGMDEACVGRTRVWDAAATSDPHWKEEPLHIYCAHSASDVVIAILVMAGAARDIDPATSTVEGDVAAVVGRAYLPVDDIAGGQLVDRWLPLCDANRRPLEGLDTVRVQLLFRDVSADPESRWGRGILGGLPSFLGVPRTFYGQHSGYRVTLYQDASVARAAAGRRSSCWADIFDAISNARRLVYIAGWSINADVALLRDPRRPAQTLGQLLKKKAGEHVAVLVLVSTHGVGEDTAAYFRGTGVHCVLCPRGNAVFAHQQKAVVVDGPRGLVGFLGGIDLCTGRYDTPEHPLFRTLGAEHHADFQQPSFPTASVRKGGPREPWHGAHCRVEGPVAWDVLDNFEQRWRKQGGGDSLLVQLPRSAAVPEAATAAAAAALEDNSWNVQVFRSISGSAVVGFPDAPEEAARCGLVAGGEGAMERSIQDAYIHAIRRARLFIYIESQHFVGSSYGWLRRGTGTGRPPSISENLVPKELSLKIASKIRANDSFRVYVVLPMWPEGVPESAPVQAILDWQRRTMEMMYRDIALAIKDKGIQATPRDYLGFFCLGNREAYSPGEYVPPERPEMDSEYMRAQQKRRFKINVHANTMIVDDEYIILGSASIDQRSMDGGRDTEMAIGAYQPKYLYNPNVWPYRAWGQVQQFRLALWREHLGEAAAQDAGDNLLYPWTTGCWNKLGQVARQHWDMYVSETYQAGNLPGHLMTYPIGVSDGGELRETAAFFPDTNARVFGDSSASLPHIPTA